MKEELLHMDQLAVGYKADQQVIRDINVRVQPNQLILLIGDNGSGKSTLLKTISGVIPPLGGSIQLGGKPLQQWNSKELAKELAFVSSKLSVNHLMSVEEFIYFGRYPYSNWLARISEADQVLVEEAIEVCGLQKLTKKPVNEISDGERQKVFIARAFAQQTAITILDEPTTHLDIKNSNSIFQLLKIQKAEKSRTIIFSSHQVEKALKVADLIWLINDGYLCETTPAEFNANEQLQAAVFGTNN